MIRICKTFVRTILLGSRLGTQTITLLKEVFNNLQQFRTLSKEVSNNLEQFKRKSPTIKNT